MTVNAAPAERAGAIATLHPAYFALVMATGIVSIAADVSSLRPVAQALFALNVMFYAVLWTLTALRVAMHGRLVLADLSDHGRAVGFFTTVAATCVLGSQCLVIGGAWSAAAMLWLFGIALWAATTYTVFTVLTVKSEKPPLAQGLNGGWLTAVVAAQSVSVLGAQLAAGFGDAEAVLLFALLLWLGGGMLYIWIISLIFYRYTFFTLSPSDLAPPYWINMGAVAISTLAGTFLIRSAPESALIRDLLPFVKGLTLLFWATATWWIPMLVILGVWRHAVRRFPLRYDPLYWAAVFPLGMYTVATHRLAEVLNLSVVLPISRVFVWIALGAWSLAFVGLVRHTLTTLAPRRRAVVSK
jgi:tellurite resistance protein TehA-like permease